MQKFSTKHYFLIDPCETLGAKRGARGQPRPSRNGGATPLVIFHPHWCRRRGRPTSKPRPSSTFFWPRAAHMAGAGPSSASLARAAVGGSGTNRLPNAGILRIQQELHTLIRDPVPFIYVAADESDISKITTLIVGPLETPYAVCC